MAGVLFACLLAACAGAAPSPAASGTPGGSPTPVPTQTLPPGSVEHATGPADLVLRVEEGGGFVAPGFLVTEGPLFSLYGNGTVIFRDATANPPEPVGNVSFNTPYQIAKLTEQQIQTLVTFAIGLGGLAVSRANYQLPVADAPTTTFTLTAAGITKTTSVNGLGLGIDMPPGPDSAILAQLSALRSRLVDFGNDIVGEQPWAPDRYRGILTPLEGQAQGPVSRWPWTTIQPSDFVAPADPNVASFPRRTLLPADVAILGLAHVEGGARGIFLSGPDGKTYELALRPLLPDEKG